MIHRYTIFLHKDLFLHTHTHPRKILVDIVLFSPCYKAHFVNGLEEKDIPSVRNDKTSKNFYRFFKYLCLILHTRNKLRPAQGGVCI